jgi:hypothetical protein
MVCPRAWPSGTPSASSARRTWTASRWATFEQQGLRRKHTDFILLIDFQRRLLRGGKRRAREGGGLRLWTLVGLAG